MGPPDVAGRRGHAGGSPEVLLKRVPRRPDCATVILFYLAVIGIVAMVAVGFLRTFRQIQSIARAAQDPEHLARHIGAAMRRSGVDPDNLRVEVKVEGRGGSRGDEALAFHRPTPIDAPSPGRPERWLALTVALLVVAAGVWVALDFS